MDCHWFADCFFHPQDLKKHTLGADVVVCAAGVANLIGAEHVRKGAIVIDVGINFVPDEGKASGFRLVGDVDFEAVKVSTNDALFLFL